MPLSTWLFLTNRVPRSSQLPGIAIWCPSAAAYMGRHKAELLEAGGITSIVPHLDVYLRCDTFPPSPPV
jgi:hypothetical protein